MNKTILVTGGLGFIGSHLVELLLNKGFYNIWIVDNLQSNSVEKSFFKSLPVSIENIHEWINKTGIKFDIIYHLASPVGPTGVLKYPGDIGRKVLEDIVALRDYCIKNNTLLIDISTSEVYGYDGNLTEGSEKVFSGDYQVRTEYGAAKMLAEIALVNKARINKDLRFQIIRPFNVAGARQRPDGGFVIPRFVIATLTDQPITIYGDGLQKRSFTDVRDVVDGIFKVSMLDRYNEIWNVGNEKNKMSIIHIAGMIVGIAQNKYGIEKIQLIHVDPKELHGNLFSEVPDKIANSNKLRSVGWAPKYTVEDILWDTFKFYDQEIKNGYRFGIWEE